MTLAIVYTRAAAGIHAPLVTVEVHLSRGIPKLNIVGLPEAVVKESWHRVRSACLNANFEFPRGRVTINLAPADLPKNGSRLDLPIALAVLAASRQIPGNTLSEYEFVGELALSGELRPVQGALPIVLSVKKSGRCLIVPQGNAPEASLIKEARVLSANHLLDVCGYLQGKNQLATCDRPQEMTNASLTLPDLADVRGQPHAKRALEIAAAGKHSLLFIGSPGTGKTMLASRLPSILPELTEQEAIETATIASISHHGFDPTKWKTIPFRAPHHTSSSAALVGGGRPPKPGEISLAHHGVLFLDELLEFNRSALESLREPLESGKITISRAAAQAIFPAQFQLIAAMNPCPCGYAGNPQYHCRCTEEQIKRYFNKLSGPLLDRVDLHIDVPNLPPSVLTADHPPDDTSEQIKIRVEQARQCQFTRQGKCNQALTVNELKTYSFLKKEAQTLLGQAMQKLHFSARVYYRILRVARTIADIASHEEIGVPDISEALTYRCLDRLKNKQ